jgi:carbon starvation protein
MLAAIGLCLGTTILLKMNLQPGTKTGRPAVALITLIPLVWLLAVTFTAGVEKIWHSDPRIGFLAQAKALSEREYPLGHANVLANAELLKAGLRQKSENLESVANLEKSKLAQESAMKAFAANRTLRFNNLLDAAVTGTFLTLVSVIVLISLREWFLLLSRRKPAVLHETEPVWLPDYALKESGPNLRSAAGAAAIALGLAKELSGETQFERAKQQACACEQHSDQKFFVQVTEAKFNGVRRCC